MNAYRGCLSGITALLLVGSATAHAGSGVSLKTVKKAGAKLVACPKHVGNLRSGLVSDVLKKNVLCVSGGTFGKLAKKLSTKRLVLDGTFSVGRAFPAVVDQEGDVQTEPFEVINYPAIISYSVTESDMKSSFRIATVDAATGKDVKVIFRSHGSLDGEYVLNKPGRYYLKMNAFGDAKEELQPVFSVSVSFMDIYEGDKLSLADVKDGEVKPTACPRQFLDMQSGRLFNVSKKFLCIRSGFPEDGGFVTAPFNTGISFFMATDISVSGEGDSTTFPFRVSKTRNLTYSVEDPTNGKGRFSIVLVDLATGRTVGTLVTVKGSISGTTTSINIPGDYYLLIKTTASKPEENGEISWSVDVPLDE